jgi:glycosyltransferase involved in cell wall biosynthesis
MHPDKGVHTACRIARAAGVPLVVAAKMHEPAERAYFEDAVRPLLGGNIEYVGEVGGDDKLALLGDARCLLNPIAWPEPFGMVMVEAMACGTPVLARPVGSVPEIVDDGVTGFVRATEAELADGLLAVGRIDRADCRRSVEVRFDAGRMVAEHVALYEKVASSGAGSRVPVLTG